MLIGVLNEDQDIDGMLMSRLMGHPNMWHSARALASEFMVDPSNARASLIRLERRGLLETRLVVEDIKQWSRYLQKTVRYWRVGG